MTSQPTSLAATRTRPPTPTPYAGFGAALKDWLRRTDRSQKELAHVLHVDQSTVTYWVQGQKRPDGKSLVKLLAAFRGWFGGHWTPDEGLDALACLGYDWAQLQAVSQRHFQEGGVLKTSKDGGKLRGQRNASAFCHLNPCCTCRAPSNAP